jgi:hypothetical protein
MRSSIWLRVSRTSTSGSTIPVGRTICSTIRADRVRSYSPGVADTKTICGVIERNSSKVCGRLSSALGSRNPYSTRVCLRERSPSYIPPSWGTVWWDSSMKQTKSSGK